MAKTPITPIRFSQEEKRLMAALVTKRGLTNNTELLKKLIREDAKREGIELEDFGNLQIYVKNTSNCSGLSLRNFKLLSETWTGDYIVIPFADEGHLRVVGVTDNIFNHVCGVRCAKVEQANDGAQGYLIWGGNSGVRVLSEDAEVIPGVNDHLPQGYGMPLVWVEDIDDLPQEVRETVEDK